MTEAEQGLLFVEFLGAANGVFANYMTLVFAMLTASWFLAARSIEAAVWLPWLGSIVFFFAIRREKADEVPELD